MKPQLDAFVDYQIFCDGIRSRIHPDDVNPVLNNFLANAINEARWSTLASWLQHRLMRLVIPEQSSNWSTGLKKLLAELCKEVAWFERQVWAINQHSLFTSKHHRYHLAPSSLFQHYWAEDLLELPAFPLLPISQQYTPRAVTQAILAFSAFLTRRDDSRDPHGTAAWVDNLARRGQQHLLPRWENAMRDEDRRRLSRNIWNAFVDCLLYDAPKPDLEVMFNVYQDVILDEFGAAPVFPPTAFIAHRPFPSDRDVQHVNYATIHLALTAIGHRALAVRRHTQLQAMQQWQMFCEVYLAWKGGWAAFGLEDKVALVRELKAVWAQMPTWTMALPNAMRIFQCIDQKPLSLVCLDRVKAGHDMNIILHANPQLQPHGDMSPHAHLVLQPGDSDPQAAPHSHQGVSASSYNDFSNPASPQREAGLILILDPPSPHTLPADDLAYPQQTLESHQGSPAGSSQFLSPNRHEPHGRRRPTLRSSSPAPQQHNALPDESVFGGGYHSLASVKHRLGRDRAEATRTW